jgi:sugar lactone lactonase YvrE
MTIAGGNTQRYRSFQLSLSHSICIDDDGTIYIADCSNDRIVKWKPNATEGQIVAGGHRKGN